MTSKLAARSGAGRDGNSPAAGGARGMRTTPSTTTTEWGFPVADDRRLFEKLCLEGFQSGLSWLTILRKRENFRKAFRDFDFDAVARFAQARASSGGSQTRASCATAARSSRSSTTRGGTIEVIDDVGSLAALRLGARARDSSTRAPQESITTPCVALTHDAGVHGAQQGTEAARLLVRRPDHDVRLHAIARDS